MKHYEEMKIFELFPMTLVIARHGYFGDWYALNQEHDTISEDINGGDSESYDFITTFKDRIGIGNSPEEAIDDLLEKKEKLIDDWFDIPDKEWREYND